MSRRRFPRPEARRAAPDASSSTRWKESGTVPPFAVPLAALAIAAGVFAGALPYYFAQDDFAGLARAAGEMPRLAGPWRIVSGQVYFDVMKALAGLDPLPYRIASLAVHALSAALLAWLLARRFPAVVALAGALVFAAHPAHFTALYSVSGIGELLALGLALATLAVAARTTAHRWLAAPLFALSLLSKESTLMLPIAMLGLGPQLASGRGKAGEPRGAALTIRDPLLWTLSGLSLAYLVSFLGADAFSTRSLPSDAPYALSAASLPDNALTYLGWTANVWLATVRGFSDAVDPQVFGWGIAAALLWGAGCFAKPLRERGWIAGGLWFAMMLAPVLPLRNHTYHYYLYAPLAGVAWCAAALFDFASTRGPGAVRGAVAVLGLSASIGFALNGALLVRKVESMPFYHPEMRADPTVDRARIARNVFEGLRAQDLPEGATLWFWSPALSDSTLDPRAEYWEQNLRSALLDGLAVRVWWPKSKGARFVHQFQPAPSSDRYAIYSRDGRLRVVTPGALDSLLRAQPIGN